MRRWNLYLLIATVLFCAACSRGIATPVGNTSGNDIKLPPINNTPVPETVEIATSTVESAPEMLRVVFDTGATSALMKGTLPSSGKHSYILWITAGQKCSLRLSKDGNPLRGATLAMYGNDGKVLLSESEGATSWDGMIPSSQDYIIDVVGQEPNPIDYTLEVIIPPLMPELSEEKVKHALLNTDRGPVQLDEGIYSLSESTESGNEMLWSIEIIERYPIIFTDLDADGIDEAVAFTMEWSGGTGQFIALNIFVNQEGEAVNVAMEQLGDRIVVNATDVQDDQISLSLTVHGPDDPLCCPNMEVVQTYRFSEDTLVLIP